MYSIFQIMLLTYLYTLWIFYYVSFEKKKNVRAYNDWIIQRKSVKSKLWYFVPSFFFSYLWQNACIYDLSVIKTSHKYPNFCIDLNNVFKFAYLSKSVLETSNDNELAMIHEWVSYHDKTIYLFTIY